LWLVPVEWPVHPCLASYGSTFFLATGFHGFHVIIGTIFLKICGIRQYRGHLTKEHHVGFEAARRAIILVLRLLLLYQFVLHWIWGPLCGGAYLGILDLPDLNQPAEGAEPEEPEEVAAPAAPAEVPGPLPGWRTLRLVSFCYKAYRTR
jgi:hypothetical protein